jgi:parallel beta-helix repeat protein
LTVAAGELFHRRDSIVLTRLTLAGSVLGASLALAAPALATPSPARVAVPHTARVGVAPATTPGAGPILYVSPSGMDTGLCTTKKQPCATIAYAMGVAPTTATVKLAAGTYPEQLAVTKNLTFVGAGQASTIIEPTSLTNVDNDPNDRGVPQAEIVNFEGTSSGGLEDLTVNGTATAEPTEDGCAQGYEGVTFFDATGKLVSVRVTGIDDTPSFYGCQQGFGVYVANGDGAGHTVTMTSITVDNYEKDGILCINVGTVCTIGTSKVTGSGPNDQIGQNGIELDNLTSATVTGTSVSQNIYTSPQYDGPGDTYYSASGVLAFNAGTLTVSHSVLTGNDDDLYAVEDPMYGPPAQGTWTIFANSATKATNDSGVDPGSVPVPLGDQVGDGIDLAGPADVNVFGNTVTGNADWGIALFGATDSNIGGPAKTEPNTVSMNADDGIYLGEYEPMEPSSGNMVANNIVSKNGVDGILADGADPSGDQQAADNTLSANQLTNNAQYDAEDLSTGSETAGTGDTWTGNTCKPAKDSFPAGLCS